MCSNTNDVDIDCYIL